MSERAWEVLAKDRADQMYRIATERDTAIIERDALRERLARAESLTKLAELDRDMHNSRAERAEARVGALLVSEDACLARIAELEGVLREIVGQDVNTTYTNPRAIARAALAAGGEGT